MSSLGVRSLFLAKHSRGRAERARVRRRFRFDFELQTLESRITPTSVTGLNPASGPAAGGTLVTITGTGFTGVTSVKFGLAEATNETFVNATTITADSPAGTGVVDVVVTASGGTSPINPDDQFTYIAAPVVSSIAPAFGPAAGGTLVTITGTGFSDASAVDFGTTAAAGYTVVNSTSITAESPPGTAPVHVTVTTPGGVSATSPSDIFTYAPTVTNLNPTFGPAAGGTPVTITGTGFTGATVVHFGTASATNLTVVNSTTITVDSPAGTGTVDVTVTTPAGMSTTSPADQFSYGPTVTSLNPAFGPAAGGTLVTITGTGFTGATVVDFGSTAATNFTVVTDTSITAESPAGTGAVDVTVMTPNGTSATSSGDVFTYAPTVTGLTPNQGPEAGNTFVTITGTGFTGATAVDFGTTPATNLTVVNGTTITVDSPAGTGTVDVTITTPAGMSATSSADHFNYIAAPSVASLNPASGPTAGGTIVTITGANFTGASEVDFGTTAALAFTVVSDTSITATSPAGTGVVDVTVTTPGGKSTTSANDQFSYLAAPTVTSLNPAGGPLAGGTLVTITGTGFTGATAVHFGGNLATNLTVVSDTSITVDSPAGTGTVNVLVTTPGGTSATSPSDLFSYGPTVTNVTPASGPVGGGTLVTITGTGFTGATAVNFGPQVGSILNVNDTTINAYSPAGTGTVDVTVTTPTGTSAVSPDDKFTYVAAPTVTGVSPNVGPLGGGTVVTITGTGFSFATQVDFGSTPATNLTIVSDTSLTVDSPAGTGIVDVTVTNPAGKSATSSSDRFQYVAAPTVTGLSPAFGPAAGATFVTITGTGFTGATVVDFGANPGTNLTVISDTSITVDSPPGTGIVDVTVTAPGGTSATTSHDQFTYAPTVTGVSPAAGPQAGGTLVTVTGTGFTGATAVDFGMTAGTNLTVISPTELTVDSPAGTGVVDVTVIAPSGNSATSAADKFTYVAAPVVSGLSPTFGPAAGGTFVVITGSGFTGTTAVNFGANPAATFSVVNDTTIEAVSPAGTVIIDVTVTTVGGTSAHSNADQFTYGPTVTGISPAFGPSAGGTVVMIAGTGFTGATAVDFGTASALAFLVDSTNLIEAVSPPGVNTVNVTVTTPSGTSPTSTVDVFTYGPVVTLVSPNAGPNSGGTLVTITGTSLANATAVFFGTTQATTIVSDSATQIQVVSPASTVFGAVDIRVITPGGTSPITTADQFFYSSAGAVVPRVASIAPRTGPTSGGTFITITGTGFDQSTPTAVFFGQVAATDVTVVSPTTITAVSPAESAGAVNVMVVTYGGSSSPSPGSQFVYIVSGPQVSYVVRYGYHNQPTYLVINFAGGLDTTSAERASNYTITAPNGKRIRVRSAVYNISTASVTLALAQRLNLPKTYRLTINGIPTSGLKNPQGIYLDGAGNGSSGTDYVTTITRANLAGSAAQRPGAAVVKAKSLVARAKAFIHKHTKA
jgi:hypothetical protein